MSRVKDKLQNITRSANILKKRTDNSKADFNLNKETRWQIMAAWRRKLMSFWKMKLSYKRKWMNLSKRETEESLIIKELLKKIGKFISLKLLKLNKNARNLRIEDQLWSLNLRRKELSGVLRRISYLLKSKKSKNSSTELKEETSNYSKKMKDSRVTKIERDISMAKVLLVQE